MAATFDGQYLFGDAVNVQHIPNEAEFQTNTYFGQKGRVTLSAGQRGRTFRITGVLRGPDIATINAMEAAIDAYNDGFAYTFVDTRDRIWNNVQYRGGFRPDERGFGRDGAGNYTLKYEMVLHGLI